MRAPATLTTATDFQATVCGLLREIHREVMLTGYSRRTANAVSKQLGIDVEAALLPQDKQKIIAKF
jgi:cation transport ATPase